MNLSAPQPGVVSHYRLVELLGRGGMGEVWRAEDLQLPRSVAIKLLPHHLSADREAAERMLEDARALESAGADALLLECVPNPLGAAIRDAVQVPVIGIGAGPGVDGQILVLYDVLGITQGRMPRFVKNYMTGRDSPLEALRAYVRAVKDRSYPAEEHCFTQ